MRNLFIIMYLNWGLMIMMAYVDFSYLAPIYYVNKVLFNGKFILTGGYTDTTR
jgi:hypothetical protein